MALGRDDDIAGSRVLTASAAMVAATKGSSRSARGAGQPGQIFVDRFTAVAFTRRGRVLTCAEDVRTVSGRNLS
jgi:hypothetical protein